MNTQKTQAVESKKSKKPILVVVIIIFTILILSGLFIWQRSNLSQLNFVGKSTEIKPKLGNSSTTNVVNKSGGNLNLESKDKKITLDFPKNSVFQNQPIKLTEIKSVSGIGNGAEFMAGIDISPSGTNLLAPAELVINLDTTDKKIMAFSYEENGQDFHLVPALVQKDKVIIQVTNFSGYGIINVGDSTYTPPSPEAIDAQAKLEIAKILLEVQTRQKAGDKQSLTNEDKNKIYDYLNRWYDQGIKPDLEKSVANENLIEPTMYHFNKWRAVIQLAIKWLGIDDVFKDKYEAFLNMMAQAVNNAYLKADKKCTTERDATQIAKMTKWASFAQYWDLDGRSGLSTADLIDKTKKCARFELKINSKIDTPKAESQTSASGTILIGIDDNMNLIGGGEIKEDSRIEKGFACNYPEGAPVYPAEIIASKLDTGKGGQRVSLVLQFPDGEDKEHDCVSTEVENFTTSNLGNEWMGGYFLIYHDETYIETGKFVISDWEIINSGGIYAKKTVNRTKSISVLGFSLPIVENTTYELIHKPNK